MVATIMKFIMQSRLQVIIFPLVSLLVPQVTSLEFSWGWGGRTVNYTKVVTPNDVVQHYSLHFPFKQCSFGMEGVMTRLLLYPCTGYKDRCILTPGENVTLEVEFISNIPAERLVGSLSVIFTRWFSPTALGEPQDLCQSEHITCPIQPFSPYRYRRSIFVRPTLPPLSPDIRVVIQAENDREIACAIVPVAIMGHEQQSRDGLRETTLAI